MPTLNDIASDMESFVKSIEKKKDDLFGVTSERERRKEAGKRNKAFKEKIDKQGLAINNEAAYYMLDAKPELIDKQLKKSIDSRQRTRLKLMLADNPAIVEKKLKKVNNAIADRTLLVTMNNPVLSSNIREALSKIAKRSKAGDSSKVLKGMAQAVRANPNMFTAGDLEILDNALSLSTGEIWIEGYTSFQGHEVKGHYRKRSNTK